jgi:hypothetical protein
MDNGILNLPRSMVAIGGSILTGGSASLQAPLTVTAPSATAVPLTLQLASGQTADAFDIKNSAGTVLAKVDSSGNILQNATASSTSSPSLIGVYTWGAGNAARWQFGDAWTAIQNANANDMQIYSYWGMELRGGRQNLSAAPTFAQITNVGVSIINEVAASTAVVVKGAASQTADLQQWVNSSSTVLTSIDKLGRLSAPNVEAVTATMGAAAGTTPPAAVVTGCNDVRGTLTFGTGTTPGTGTLITVTFPTAFAAAPTATISPANSATQALGLYIVSTSTTTLVVGCATAPAASQGNTTYALSYHCFG